MSDRRNSHYKKKSTSLNINVSEIGNDDNVPKSSHAKTPPAMMVKKKISQAGTLQRKASFGAIGDLVQCPLCLDKLSTPKMLSCQHTFCLECLYSQVKGSELHCPLCKSVYPVDSPNSLENLPSNLYIDNLLRLLTSPATSNMPSYERSLSYSIPETVQKQCTKCQSVITLLTDHCCEHCKQIFCGVCWSVHISELKAQIDTLISQLKVGSERLNHRHNGFKDRNEWLVNQITTTTEKKIDEILSKKESLLKKANEILENGEKSATTLQNQLEAMESNVREYVTKDFDSVADDKEKVSAFMSFHRTTVYILNEVAHWGESKYSFDQENFCIEEDANIPTEAEVDEPIAVEVKGIQNPLESPDSLTLYYRSRNFAPRLVWKKCPRPAGTGMAPWSEHLYVCATDSQHVMVIDKLRGKIIERISNPKMLYPQSITFSKLREEIYISDKWNHCIHVFSRNGNHLRTIGSKGSKEGHLRNPEGISIEPNENLLYICDTGNDRVQIFHAQTGEFVGCIGVYKKMEGSKTVKYTQLNAPTAIATTWDRIIIADSGNRRVKIYSYNGEKQHEFGSSGSLKGQFKHPEAITVDPLGFIIVGDSGNARIQIFKPNGQLLRVLGNQGYDSRKFGWISALYITPQLEIIVSDTKLHQVAIF